MTYAELKERIAIAERRHQPRAHLRRELQAIVTEQLGHRLSQERREASSFLCLLAIAAFAAATFILLGGLR